MRLFKMRDTGCRNLIRTVILRGCASWAFGDAQTARSACLLQRARSSSTEFTSNSAGAVTPAVILFAPTLIRAASRRGQSPLDDTYGCRSFWRHPHRNGNVVRSVHCRLALYGWSALRTVARAAANAAIIYLYHQPDDCGCQDHSTTSETLSTAPPGSPR